MLVGEAPGYEEDRKGIPFIGQSGKLLDFALKQAGTDRENCYVFNTLCCRPPENRDPRPNELKACRPNFIDQLDMGDCAVGVTLGGYALANVIGEDRKKLSMADHLDKPIWMGGRIWVPAYHPAYILRNRAMMPVLVGSLKFALTLRRGSSEYRPLPTPPWEQVEIEGTKGSDLAGPLKKNGWVFLYSQTLGTQIVIIQHEGKKVPAAIAHLPRYTVDELMRVGLLGEGRRKGWTKSALRTLNMVKYELDGTVVEG
jgi:DNA polymerase